MRANPDLRFLLETKLEGNCNLYEIARLVSEIARRRNEEKIYYFTPNSQNQYNYLIGNELTKFYLTGNRHGKTTAMVVDKILKALGEHPLQKAGLFPKPPLQIRIVCTDFSSGIEKVVEPILLDWYPKDKVEKYKFNDKILVFKNGSYIELMSNEQDLNKFFGASRTIVSCDEETKKEIWDENKKRVLDQGGWMEITMTPDIKKGLTWTYNELLLKDGEDGIRVYRGTTYDNKDNIPEQALKDWESKLTKDEKEVFIYGNYLPLSGFAVTLIPEWHIIPPLQVRPQSWLRLRSIDVGGSGDSASPTACLWASIENKGDTFIMHIEDEYEGWKKTITENAGKIKDKTKYTIYQSFIDPISGKKRSLDSGKRVMDSYRDAGIYTVAGLVNVELGLNNINELMLFNDKIQSVRLKVHSNCVGLIQEMKTMTVEDVRKGKAHFLSCLRWLASAGNYKPLDIPGAIY